MAFFRFAAPATADVESIGDHIAKDNLHAAEQFIEKITGRCRALADRPLMARQRDELLPGLRSFPVGKYLIFFRLVPGGIEIIRVIHGARDIAAAFHVSQPLQTHP